MPAPIDDETLMSCVLGELPEDERAGIEAAVNQSPDLKRRFEAFRSLVADMRMTGGLAKAFEVPAAQRAALKRLGEKLRAAPATTAAGLAELLARLVFDSWARPAAAGYRAGGVTAERLLRFEFPGGSVDVRIAPDAAMSGRFWISGELRDTTAASARVVAVGREVDKVGGVTDIEIGDDGYFEVQVTSGDHTLEMLTAAGRVVIGPIDVGR